MRPRDLSALILIVFLLFSCGKTEDPLPVRRDDMRLSYGLDSLIYNGWAPLAKLPVKVYYYIPSGRDIKNMPVLFAMHGADRNGLYQVENWIETADDRVIVIAPEFTQENYPPILYQYGGVSASTGKFIPTDESTWTYNIIEDLFDYFKSNTGNRSAKYDLWGHSAGAQFSHRMALFMRNNRINRVVCSNSGFYTVPDPNGSAGYSYPYSVKGTDMETDNLRRYFAMDLTVHLGTADLATTKEEDSYLPVDIGSRAQGSCRFERGHFFYERSQAVAQSMGTPFNWKLVEVPGVPHSSRKMIQNGVGGAAFLLYY